MDKANAAVAQARRYGVQVSMLGERNMNEERSKVRRAWVNFRRQFEDELFGQTLVNEYWDAYLGYEDGIPYL